MVMVQFPDSGARAVIDQLVAERQETSANELTPKVVLTPQQRQNIREGFRQAAWILRDAIDGTVRC